MRFKSIEITNYRQYRNLKFSFPLMGQYDLHIIVGRNTMGKTNVLNAINWCLYGLEPHLGMNSKILPKINLDAKKDAIAAGKTTEWITVIIAAEDDNHKIIFERKLPFNLAQDFELQDQFTVTMSQDSGDSLIYSADEAKSIVNKYMPETIRKYFYFDGEQLNTYFIGDQSSRIMDSIRAISQVDIISRIAQRLDKIIKKKQAEAGLKAQDIGSINTELNKIEGLVGQYKRQIEDVKTQIDVSNKIIKENSEYLQGQEDVSELEKKFSRLKEEHAVLETEGQKIERDLLSFVKEYKILLTSYPFIKKTLDIIQEKEEQNLLPPNIDKKILQDILASHKCLICNHMLDRNDEANIKSLLDQIQVSSGTSHLLIGIKSELERAMIEVNEYQQVKNALLAKYRVAQEKVKKSETAIDTADKELRKFSNKEIIINKHKERKEQEDLLVTNNQKLGALQSQLDISMKQLSALEKKLASAMEKNNECARINKSVDFLKRAKNVAVQIEQEMMDEVKSQMEKSCMKYFSQLNWRQDIYDRIELDDSYQLDLFHKEGYSCVGTCSAAERSLLALSFTLALQEVSGFNALLFIDTPVARIADVNRTNFALVLKEASKGKQIILAFTPDEYSEQIRNVLEGITSTSVTLEMDEANATGTII